jgi:hypothetical protein
MTISSNFARGPGWPLRDPTRKRIIQPPSAFTQVLLELVKRVCEGRNMRNSSLQLISWARSFLRSCLSRRQIHLFPGPGLA